MWGNIVAKQKPCGKHCNNLQCLKKKLQSKILNQLNMKKIKSTKTILKKRRRRRRKFIKKNHVGKHCSNP
jgi:hypothetical protein